MKTKNYDVILVSKVLVNERDSFTITGLYDHKVRKMYFSLGDGHNNVLDLIPGGNLYLSSDWDDAVKILEDRAQEWKERRRPTLWEEIKSIFCRNGEK